VRTADFHYDLPVDRIAQSPAERRDGSRLLVFDRGTGRVEHRRFTDLIEYLRAGDLVVLNDSRVIPARLRGCREGRSGQVEVLLVEENACNDWWAMLRPGKRVRVGTRLHLARHAAGVVAGPDRLVASVVAKDATGLGRLRFEAVADVRDHLAAFGEVPLPPYITRDGLPTAADRERYQTVYARAPGSVAAPTAGLHFTPETLARLAERRIETAFVTLHVGLGTFAPVKAARLEDHAMHAEAFEVSPETAQRLNAARRAGRRVVAVGTTTVRVLETVARGDQGEAAGVQVCGEKSGATEGSRDLGAAPTGVAESGGGPGAGAPGSSRSGQERGHSCPPGTLPGRRCGQERPRPENALDCRGQNEGGSSVPQAGLFRRMRGRTRLFIHPPFEFRAVDALLTNFHLPESTLLMLVSAFAAPGSTAGREQVLAVYREAVEAGYRFFSYGDAMLLV
jgi:S-adenosylmethionine:tRNA ribosyltransferase-isomerase